MNTDPRQEQQPQPQAMTREQFELKLAADTIANLNIAVIKLQALNVENEGKIKALVEQVASLQEQLNRNEEAHKKEE